jgi:CheY-like chemotaxis protein
MAGLTALVVDDSKTARIALKRSLEKLGFTVDFAESGENAIEYLAAATKLPHVVFMDMMMPGMGGLQAIQEISKDPKTADLHILLCSSNESEDDRQAAVSRGAKGLVSKPPVKEQLEEVVKALGDVAEVEVEDTVAPEPAAEVVVEKPAPVKAVPEQAAVVKQASPSVTKKSKTQTANAGDIERQVEELTKKFVQEIAAQTAKTVANDVARATAMNVASSTAKEVARTTLPESVNGIAHKVLENQLKTLPGQVKKLIDQRMVKGCFSDETKSAIIDALRDDIQGMIDDATAAAEDHAFAAASEAVKKGVMPLKIGFGLLSLVLLSTIVMG